MNLVYYIAYAFVKRQSKKPLFGREYIDSFKYLLTINIVYEIGARLGLMYREKIEVLFELITNDTSNISTQLNGIKELAVRTNAHLNPEIKNFNDLVMEFELPELVDQLNRTKVIKQTDIISFLKAGNQKIPTELALYIIQPLIYTAIGFGVTYPNKTADYLTSIPNLEKWNIALESGLNIPHTPDTVETLEQQFLKVKEIIKPFVLSQRPDLIEQLDLL
jgi:hypothetical protein